jgi:hypothetical protein
METVAKTILIAIIGIGGIIIVLKLLRELFRSICTTAKTGFNTEKNEIALRARNQGVEFYKTALMNKLKEQGTVSFGDIMHLDMEYRKLIYTNERARKRTYPPSIFEDYGRNNPQ